MAALPAIFSFSPNPGFYRLIITIFQQIKEGAFLPVSKEKYDILFAGLAAQSLHVKEDFRVPVIENERMVVQDG
ncbi:hypothetical protein EDD75_0560 [Thermodesulfitimonas autotrophica]|uniref:Uncharacterized protein n=1 Tax=Thermodesulfitimonas autotrophica TaxID=1894989 RepID=A0A3N5B2G2_9THEO|nr:hypothetical protein EDD75_0560 [Thermodesulfitimonas autotrophica]